MFLYLKNILIGLRLGMLCFNLLCSIYKEQVVAKIFADFALFVYCVAKSNISYLLQHLTRIEESLKSNFIYF